MSEKQTIETGNSLPPPLGSQDNRCCENCLWWSTFLGDPEDGECIVNGEGEQRWPYEMCPQWANR